VLCIYSSDKIFDSFFGNFFVDISDFLICNSDEIGDFLIFFDFDASCLIDHPQWDIGEIFYEIDCQVIGPFPASSIDDKFRRERPISIFLGDN